MCRNSIARLGILAVMGFSAWMAVSLPAGCNPSPGPGVVEPIATGQTIVPEDGNWDIDLDQVNVVSGDVDVVWGRISDTERSLDPGNDTEIALVTDTAFEDIDLPFLKTLDYEEISINGSDVGGVIAVGTIIAVETSEKNLAKLQVIQFRQDAGEIGFEWALFDQ